MTRQLELTRDTFDVLIVIGRPASGKSELVDYLQNTPLVIRRRKYHITEVDVLDDFPILWGWFEEDRILSEVLKQPRLYTDEQGFFKNRVYWHLLLERLSQEYQKRLRDDPQYHLYKTTIVEFSRGSGQGGYREAFRHIAKDILKRAAIIYVWASYEESVRRNRRRYNPDRPDSILEHGLPDDKMEQLYRDDDWDQLSAEHPHYLLIRSLRIPYVVFENEDDVTAGIPDRLAVRLEASLRTLWGYYRSR